MIPVRVCVVAVLSLLVLPSVNAGPCDYRRNADVRFRATAYDVVADFNDVWVATGHGVALWNRAGTSLQAGPSIAVPGTTVALAGTTGGVWAGSGSGIYLIERTPTLRIASSVQLDAEVNDLVAAGNWLYAATRTGIVQIDVLDRNRPAIANRLNTTSGSALSVAVIGQHLYAADGDRTVEAYAIATPTIPQKVGTFDSLPRTLTVHGAGDHLFVSDGQQTEVFAGSAAAMTRLATFRFGATAVASASGSLRFVAGSDRTIRAINVLAPVPTVHAISSTDLTSGTVNRVTALTTAGDLLIAAGGDAGVAAWSLASFASPFPSASVEVGAIGSAWFADQRVVVALPAGGLRRYTESSGVMNPGPTWEQLRIWKIQDGEGSAVLATAGATIALFDAAPATPATLSTGTLGGAIIGAAMSGSRKAVVLLADKTAWSVDLSQAAATATKLAIAGAPTYVAASAAGIAFGEVGATGNTTIRFYRGGEIANPVEVTIDGTSNGGIALSAGGIAAAATFRGIALADVASGGAPRYVEGSAGVPIRDLEIEGDRLLALGADALAVRRLSDGGLVSSWILAADGEQVQAAGGRAIVAGPAGFTVVDLAQPVEAPVEIALVQDAARFFRSIHRDGSLLWLVERTRADVLFVDALGLPHPVGSLEYDETIVAAAAARGNLYTLTAAGKLIARNSGGQLVGQIAIAESADQVINGMNAVGGAIWISITRGCSSGGCEKKSLVLDAAQGLVITAAIPGGILDAHSEGTRAWVISDSPREVRVYDVTSAGAPVLVSSAAAPGDPVSVAHTAGSVWTLGARLQRWTETLQPQGEFLSAWTADPTGRLAYIDQKVRAAGGCVLVTGRDAAPSVFQPNGDALLAVPSPASPGAVRGAVTAGATVHLLGETFLEGWTTAAPPERGRLLRR